VLRGTVVSERLPVVKPGAPVDGRVVRADVPNMSSIGASFTDYTLLPGVREVQMSEFDREYVESVKPDARTKALAQEIAASGELNPLIIALDADGAYIVEGGHRFDALISLGAKSLPAIVVIDESNPPASILEQTFDETRRGSIQFGKDRQFNVNLLKNADLSTFLHESGHFYLEVLGDIAEADSAPEQIVQDYAAILK
jgi:hypothetical protein